VGARFTTTQWGQVLAARDTTDPESRQALAALCEAYWYPLYAYLRSRGHDPDESRDLTQAYFAYLLEKKILEDVNPSAGRFRSFLLSSLRHYVANERRRQDAGKRGGGTPPCPPSRAQSDWDSARLRFVRLARRQPAREIPEATARLCGMYSFGLRCQLEAGLEISRSQR